MNPVLSELAFPSSEPGRMHSLESMPTLPGSVEAGVSFDLPAQADTLHSANKVMKPLVLACLLAFFFFLTRITCIFLSSPSVIYTRLVAHLKEAAHPSFNLCVLLPLPKFYVHFSLPVFVTFLFYSVATVKSHSLWAVTHCQPVVF